MRINENNDHLMAKALMSKQFSQATPKGNV